jgi:hypothetical protein
MLENKKSDFINAFGIPPVILFKLMHRSKYEMYRFEFNHNHIEFHLQFIIFQAT